MSCELTLRNYHNKADIAVYRTNGHGPVGIFKWDRTWNNYRFHPNADYSLSLGDLDDLKYLLKRIN